MNLADLLDEHPAGADDPLVCTIDEARPAGQVRTAVATKVEYLRAAGVGTGTAVALQFPDGPDLLEWLLATWRADAVAVPMNDRLPDAEREALLDEVGATLLVTPAGAGPRAVTGAGRRYREGVAVVLWTSGTTGAPKAILHTHDGYLELVDRVLGPLRGGLPGPPEQLGSPNLIPVSMTLNAGIYNVVFGLRAGAPLVLLGRFDTRRFATLVARHGIRSTVLPPAAMVALADDASVSSLAPLRYVRSITAPLSPLQARRFADRFGVTVLNGYGQAELGEVIGWTAGDARTHPDKLGAAGRPHPGVEVRILDDAGAPVVPGTVGELWVRPPAMAAGFASGDDLSDRIDAEGYVRTGDLARIDPDGFVWIEGRVGDVINRGGHKVVPEQVEEVLRLDASVTDAAVVGVPDDRLGEVPVAFVVTDVALDDAQIAALLSGCREHLVAYKVPVAVVVVDALPRNEVGKVLRRALRDRWIADQRGGRARSSAPAGARLRSNP